MMLFWEAGLVVLSVPKTGSQALEHALAPVADIHYRNPPALKHMRLRRYLRAFEPILTAEELGRLETVAVIREPFDWLGSWYRYRRRDALDGHRNSTHGRTFTQFLRASLRKRVPAYAETGSQAEFVKDDSGRIGVDHLFAYDHLPQLVAFLETRLDRQIELPQVNVSPEADAAEMVVGERLRTRIMQAREEDFLVYGQALGANRGSEQEHSQTA